MIGILEAAIRLAAKAHGGQVCKRGRPYIFHPLRLMLAANTEAERVIAVLHDVPEDCDLCYAVAAIELAEMIGEREALETVTKRPYPEETYFEHIRRARDAGGVARAVKILDVEDHIAEATTPELKKMVKVRYTKALRILRGEED